MYPHTLVTVHQYTQRTGGGDLLTLHEIGRQILRDLATQKLNTAHIGFLHAQILDDGEVAVKTDSTAHIQLSVGPQGDIHMGFLHIAADVALGIGHRKNSTQRTAALDLEGQAGALALQGVAHHGSRCESTSQSGRGNGESGVNISGALGHLTRRNSDRLDHTVTADRSN